VSGAVSGRRHVDGGLAIVTGAANGIGRAAALRLGRDGFAVGVVDREEGAAKEVADAIRAQGGIASSRPLDVREEDRVADAFGTLRDELGPLAALVHSAGILAYSPALELDERAWREVLDVNLTGAFLCDRAAARLMVEAGNGGRIVNIASVHSQAPGVGLAAYDASKGGVWMLTRNLALELAPHRVTVNAIGPGLVVHTTLGGGTSEEYLAATVPTIPLGRAGEPGDIAGVVSFLCSPDAAYVTGSMIFADGGMLLTAHT
jgi:NAD(P)-dependent dehydrogenase (short-subunit alcohol dehydrogenase family)